MLSEDYILRMISQAAAVLAQVLTRRKAGQYPEAQRSIDGMLESVFGLRADLLRRMDDESLLVALSHGGELDFDRLRVAADLYRAEGDIFADRNKPSEAHLSFLRALRLYLENILNGGSEHFPEPVQEIETVLAALPEETLSKDLWLLLHQYYNLTDQAEKAEAALAQWLGA